MGKNVFTKSENFKSEYSSAVIVVGELTPIEGSDFLAKTLVMGTQIVVRKDQVKEGDTMLYAANETQLNEKFLSVNNLFEIGCREKNANAAEVEAILKPYTDTKPEIDKLRNDAKNVKSSIDQLTKKSNKLNKEVKKIKKDMESLDPASEEYTNKSIEVKDKQEKADAYYKKALEKTTVYTGLKQKIEEMVKVGEPLVAEAKKMCGLFNHHGRVRMVRLRNEPSFGFLFSVNELQKFDPSITVEDVETYVGQEFDTVNGKLFVKAYVPPVKEIPVRKGRENKAQKKIKKFDRMIEGEFKFHYTTTQLQKSMTCFNPNDVVDIDVKLHGTSLVCGNLKVKDPIKLPIHQWLWNKVVDTTGLFKKYRIQDWIVKYGLVCSSRTVIKSIDEKQTEGQGFYKVDLWSEWGKKIYPYLDEGICIYGEIIGYETGTNRLIQKGYDYGCKEGENKLMIYRVTSRLEDGTVYEWNVSSVKEFTENLIEKMAKNEDPTAEQIHPIDVLYHGTLANLYPEISVEEHWHENVLEALKNDKEHFGMELLEPMCQNKVFREGVCLRKENDPITECFKLKCVNFLEKEGEAISNGDYFDIEMSETNY